MTAMKATTTQTRLLLLSTTIALDGVAPTGVGADSLGHLVAKFAISDLGLKPGPATLTLPGSFKDGGDFSATDQVMVK